MTTYDLKSLDEEETRISTNLLTTNLLKQGQKLLAKVGRKTWIS